MKKLEGTKMKNKTLIKDLAMEQKPASPIEWYKVYEKEQQQMLAA